MKRSRQTRAQLEAEIQALLGKKDKLADDAVKVFDKALFTKDVKDVMMDLEDDELKSMAKTVAQFIKSGGEKKLSNSSDSAKKGSTKTETLISYLRNENMDKALDGVDHQVVKIAAENITKSMSSIVSMAKNSASKSQKQTEAQKATQTQGGTKSQPTVEAKSVPGNNAVNVAGSSEADKPDARVY